MFDGTVTSPNEPYLAGAEAALQLAKELMGIASGLIIQGDMTTERMTALETFKILDRSLATLDELKPLLRQMRLERRA